MEKDMNYEKELNKLLADYQLHYQNLRSLHWNIKGENFFELHVKYEEWYTRALEIVDELAERLLTLGLQPISSFSGYLAESEIKENPIINDGKTGVQYILEAQQTLLKQERLILTLAADKADEGTSAFMSDLIREKEKENWMLRAWLNK
ncbi:DNA starvation/stationary phase protection protein [Crocinitomicaceae bacterium CZZ-1]|uniref:DNA starvation/stationary phase protection protein n=1 Tax=Taishania pollutisoli TaxID=2766479 RepID=A0A8J6TTG8_9FLAO|nr:DNA starvation/stationary phase protection protein [Taishania pollutisoli]MBC9812804.1 DNA starvation/stationary phase protection protein [Taishania pollutisoli]MBX2949745.1 DNA starvation/stationary phase protection protein [Crocinitomicaceae bacterium]NGF76165.1 DNA starvation/stationary phase protection protein [Fluviicola sp. SGL-29]